MKSKSVKLVILVTIQKTAVRNLVEPIPHNSVKKARTKLNADFPVYETSHLRI